MSDTIEVRPIKAMVDGNTLYAGQSIFFTYVFQNGGQESYVCDAALLPNMLGMLTELGRRAESMRAPNAPRSLELSVPYRVTNVGRSGHSADGKLLTIEFATDRGFPVVLAMSSDQARKTIDFLQREILLASSPQRDDRN